MTTNKHERLFWALFVTLLGTLASVVGLAIALPGTALPPPQAQPVLQITSPTSGAVVNPGQTVTVSVTSNSPASFPAVALLGDDPIGFVGTLSTLPGQFSVLIPTSGIACGTHVLTVEGTATSGGGPVYASVSIDVERADFPAQLSATLPGIALESLGEQINLDLHASFTDGTTFRVTASSLLTYSSTNTAVVTIDGTGIVTAVAPGSASVTATYTTSGRSLPISIPVTVSPPKLTVSPVSLTFGSQSVGTSSPTQQLTLTNASPDSLSVLSITPSGDFSETDNCIASSPLGASGTCAVNVTFSPTTAGTRTGNLNIANSANTVPISTSLSGTGTASPAITSLSPTSGAIGSSVTIAGSNFGATRGTSTVTFNGTTASPTNWSATSIVAPVPNGATTGNVVVTVGGLASNGTSFTVNSTSAPAFVQGASVDNTGSAVASTSVSFPSSTAAGDLIVVYVVPNPTVSTISVSDSAGNTYVAASSTLSNGSPCGSVAEEFFYAANIKGGTDTVTATLDVANGLGVVILEYSGVATASPLDAQVGTSSPTSCPWNTTPTSASFALGNTSDLIVSGAALNGNALWTAGTGYTLRAGQNFCFAVEDKVTISTGTYTGSFTTGSNMNWVATAVAFKKANP